MRENIEITRFSNGLTLLTEKMPDVHSATIGFFYRCGSRHEPENLSGICHFIEHTVFKGTSRRSSFDIATEIDRFGGNFEAYTSFEETAFILKVIDRQLPQAFDLLADMLLNPLFDEDELKREQQVIIEEMKMVEDTPEEFLSEIFSSEMFPQHSLGRSIAGTTQTVCSFNHEITKKFHQTFFQPHNLIIACAGNVEHQLLNELCGKVFHRWKTLENTSPLSTSKPNFSFPFILKQKNHLEQNHLLMATPFVSGTSLERYSATLLTTIFGGGTSSRLWQKIREEEGLAYNVGATTILFQDCGIFQIYAATSPENFSQTVSLCLEELQKIKKYQVTKDELQLAKDQVLASILLGLEDSSVRAGNLASSEIFHQKQISLDETLKNIEKVSIADIQKLADDFFVTEKLALAGLGNFRGIKLKRQNISL